MTQLFQLATDQTAVTLTCPAKKRVRLVAVSGACSTTLPGENVNITYTRGSDVLVRTNSGPITANVGGFGAAIGLGQSTINEAVIDPVTGVVTLDQGPDQTTAALPDIWFPYDVDVTVSINNGTTTALMFLYEVADYV
jgi:hypothetical protein